MKKLITAWLLFGIALFTIFGPTKATEAQVVRSYDSQNTEAQIYVFGRDDCGFCKALFAFLTKEETPFVYLNILTDEEAAKLYEEITTKHQIAKVTPITVVGKEVFVGFDSERNTGQQIQKAFSAAKDADIKTLKEHLEFAPSQNTTNEGGCTDIICDTGNSKNQFVFDLPLIGVVDLRTFSLFSLSAILGVIDGFNPCAMWVLVTFLILLSQAGSKQKMVFLAGVFILAQGIMYNLILNIWYKTWDFVALDQIVTPVVGFLALGGAIFFLWRWHKNKQAELVCDISDIDNQTKTINRFKKIVNEPITIASIFAILAIAFSVNIIEFACSIGIPQAYTKILELNALSFLERQWYILIFSLGYMLDDVVVFGLAIWGYSKIQSHGGKYAQLSLLIGGILMLFLGLLLIINPGLLVL